jgi:hypothetical protein
MDSVPFAQNQTTSPGNEASAEHRKLLVGNRLPVAETQRAGCFPGSVCSTVVCSGGSRSFGYGDIHAPAFLIEVHATFDERENRVVASQAHIPPRPPLGAALPNDNIPRNDRFAAKFLNAQPLSPRIATVPAGTLTLLMRHFYVPFPMI